MYNLALKIRFIKRLLVNIIVIVLINFKMTGQDPLSSHFFLHNSFYNPANAAFSETIDLIINYRNQLPGMGNAFSTYKAGFEGFSFENNIGIGCLISRDITGGGVFSTTWFDTYYNYFFNINPFSKLAFALQASLYQTSINSSGISDVPQWSNYQLVVSSDYVRYFPDFSAGVAYDSKKFRLSLGVLHLLSPHKYTNDDNSLLMRRIILSGYYKFKINSVFNREEKFLIPMFEFENQDEINYFSCGLLLNTGKFEPGVWFRNELLSFKSSVIILSSKINFLNLYIVYSFDALLTNSYITFSNYGIHEVTLGYHIKYKEKRKNKGGTINCPYY